MKPNFTDKRGTITDLLVTDDYSITHITFTKDAVRGNHRHAMTKQVDFILKGRLNCAQDDTKNIVKKGDVIVHPANVNHAYKALQDSSMVSICFGVRKGTDYEKDVIRLKIPLL